MPLLTRLAVLLVTSAIAMQAPASEPDARATFKREVAQIMGANISKETTEELVASGLAESDAKRIVDRFAEDVAECFLLAVEEKLIQQGKDPKTAFDGLSLPGVGEYFENAAEAEQMMMGCLLTAAADAGLPTAPPEGT